jgi:hypothetical protein
MGFEFCHTLSERLPRWFSKKTALSGEFCHVASRFEAFVSLKKSQDFPRNSGFLEFCPFDAVLTFGANIQIPRAPEA